ncbi:pseudouridine synthase [Aegicerativicinus sediminis]
MSRHQGGNGRGKTSGRGGNGQRKKSYARGNAPIKKNAASSTNAKKEDGLIRLNKYIANSGMCSRREADMYIATGSVTVNGKVVTEMGYRVKLEDDVRFDGRRINPEKPTYILLNKPKGYAVTNSDSKDKTVMDLIASTTSSRVTPVGRLGRGSLGLVLLTNDDKLIQKFTNSNSGVARLFHLELDRNLKYEDFQSIQNGLDIDGKKVEVEDIAYIDNSSKKEIGIKVKNIGNSILRTIFGHLKYDLVKIDCVAIGPLTKKDLPRGRCKHLSQQEINNLMML